MHPSCGSRVTGSPGPGAAAPPRRQPHRHCRGCCCGRVGRGRGAGCRGALYGQRAGGQPGGEVPGRQRATLAIPEGERRALLVPEAALVREGDLIGVRVREASGFELRWVRVGTRLGGRYRSARRTPGGRAGVGAGRRGGTVKTGVAGRIADAFLESRLTPLVTRGRARGRRPGHPRDAARGGAADLGADDRRHRGAARRARRAEVENLLVAPDRAADVGDPGRGPRLLDGGRRLRAGHRALQGRRGPGAQRRRRSTRSSFAAMDQAPAGRHAAARQAALDRRRAGPRRSRCTRRRTDRERLRQIAIASRGRDPHRSRRRRDVRDRRRSRGRSGSTLDPARLAASGVTPGEVALALQAANARLPGGRVRRPADARLPRRRSGAPLADARRTSAASSSATARRGPGVPARRRRGARRSSASRPTTCRTPARGTREPSSAVTIASPSARAPTRRAWPHARARAGRAGARPAAAGGRRAST